MNAVDKHFLCEAFRGGRRALMAFAEGIEVDAGIVGGRRYIAPIFRLNSRIATRICLSPEQARHLMAGLADRLGEKPPAPRRPKLPKRPDARSKQQIIAVEVEEAFRRLEADPLLTITACAAQLGVARPTLCFRLRKADPVRKKSLPQSH